MPDHAAAQPKLHASSALHTEPEIVARMLLDRLEAAGSADLAFLFLGESLRSSAREIEDRVGAALGAGTLVTAAASGVIAGREEFARGSAASLLTATLPGVSIRPFLLQDLPRAPADADEAWAADHYAEVLGVGPSLRCTFVLADPYSVPLIRLLPMLSAARGDSSGPLLGAMLSGGDAPGQNVVSINGGFMNAGGVGVSLSGPIRVDAMVSQGCRSFGPTMLVTKARGNVLLELGGRPALEAVRDACMALPEGQRRQLEDGLYIGRVIDEYKERFGRDDYLIRAVRGIDANAEAIMTDDLFKVGQTVRLHLLDALTASEDLAMLLDKEKLSARPAGALLFSGQDRGPSLFGRPHHDAEAVHRAFRIPVGGERSAKSGTEYNLSEPASIPIAGMRTAGEIATSAGSAHLHAQTLTAALFRAEE